MEKIKRLLEEMDRNNRRNSDDEFGRESKERYGKRFKRYEDEDEDRDDRNTERNERPAKGLRSKSKYGREERGEDKYARKYHKGGKFGFNREEGEEWKKELRDLEEDVWEYIEEIKHEDPELFCMLKCDLWKAIKGPHFDEEYCEDALEEIAKCYGKREIKFDHEEAEDLAEKFGIDFKEFNESDWCYALNLIHFMFCQILRDDLESYIRIAYNWITDKSIPEGKSFWHFHRFVKSKEEER